MRCVMQRIRSEYEIQLQYGPPMQYRQRFSFALRLAYQRRAMHFA